MSGPFKYILTPPRFSSIKEGEYHATTSILTLVFFMIVLLLILGSVVT